MNRIVFVLTAAALLAPDAVARAQRTEGDPKGSPLNCSSPERSFFGREDLIPNGDKFSCHNCHDIDQGGAGARNLFGFAFLDNNATWEGMHAGDADGDGFTNGEELGDPDGLWQEGDPDPEWDYDRISNPGDYASTPDFPAPPPPPVVQGEYSLIKRASGFDSPTGVLAAKGGLFVFGKKGQVWFEKDGDRKLFLDLRTRVESAFGERGLAGLAFRDDDPNTFYVSYTCVTGLHGLPEGSGVIEERKMHSTNPDEADPNAARLILGIPRPEPAIYVVHGYDADLNRGRDHGLHNSLRVLWDEGVLHIFTGDAGTYCDRGGFSQDANSLWGKYLRIIPSLDPEADPPYSIPENNPFNGEPEVAAARREIVAWGLRNPWSVDLHPFLKDVLIGESGQARIEEINRVEPGNVGVWTNFGWPVKEGSECLNNGWGYQSGYTPLPHCIEPSHYEPPVYEYIHSFWAPIDYGYSLSGLCYYLGKIQSLQDTVLGIDHISDRMFAIREDPQTGSWTRQEVLKASEIIEDPILANNFAASGLFRDEKAEVLVVDYKNGIVWQLMHNDLLPNTAVPNWQMND